MGFDGGLGGSASVGFGAGVSAAPVPYFKTKIGYTGTFVTFNLKQVFNSWSNGTSKAYSTAGVGVVVTKQSSYVNVYMNSFKKTIRLYNNGHIRVM